MTTETLVSIPKHNLLVIGGDMNAQIGKNRHNKYSLHYTSNRNGQHLIDFMIENRLTCLNTNFQKREGKLWTYTYANKSKAQIDYVLINRKWRNSEQRNSKPWVYSWIPQKYEHGLCCLKRNIFKYIV